VNDDVGVIDKLSKTKSNGEFLANMSSL